LGGNTGVRARWFQNGSGTAAAFAAASATAPMPNLRTSVHIVS
jgi:hypothetical protein